MPPSSADAMSTSWTTLESQFSTVFDGWRRTLALTLRQVKPAQEQSSGILAQAQKELEIFRKYVEKMDDRILRADKTGYLATLMEEVDGKDAKERAKHAKKKLASEERRVRILAGTSGENTDQKANTKIALKSLDAMDKILAALPGLVKPGLKTLEILGKARDAFAAAAQKGTMSEKKLAALKEGFQKAANAEMKKVAVYTQLAAKAKAIESALLPALDGLGLKAIKVPSPMLAERVNTTGRDAMLEVKLLADQLSQAYRAALEKVRGGA